MPTQYQTHVIYCDVNSLHKNVQAFALEGFRVSALAFNPASNGWVCAVLEKEIPK
jgi:hypothetical protein